MKFSTKALAAAIATLASPQLFATNGMNLEGYGPKATGMGGASYAYDNGTAATMNNPATLGMMKDGDGLLDIALGMLGPDVTAKMTGMPDANSSGTAYYMPAAGFVQKRGNLAYGLAVFAQGGMGTEYANNSFMAAGTGKVTRSEVGVGRAILPLAVNINDDLTIGGSVDFVWATMDLMMPMSVNQMTAAGVTMGGTMAAGFAGFMGTGTNIAEFRFNDGSDFFGEAKGYGIGGKLGFTYNINDRLTIGGVYHTKTNISDLEAKDAVLSATGFGDLPGTIDVVDFQWPSTFGLGLSFQATDKLMVAADIKRINWSDTMKNFRMHYVQDGTNATLDVTMPQNWDDQTVYAIGMEYKVNKPLSLRLGANYASNPIPDANLSPLFPAIVEKHYTAGFGYQLNDDSGIDFALSYAPEVSQTNPNGGGAGVPVTADHSQLSWQVMYSMSF